MSPNWRLTTATDRRIVRCTSTLIMAMAGCLGRCGWTVWRFWEITGSSSTRGLAVAPRKKSLPKRALARSREVDHSRAFRAPRPAELEAPVEQRRAQRAGKMMAANAPIEAGAAHRPSPAHQRVAVDPHTGEDFPTLPGQLQALAAGSQQAPLLEAVEDEHAQLAGKMVVANSRLA